MSRQRIAITIDKRALARIDRLVGEGLFANRSEAFESAVRERLARLSGSRLARECAKLHPSEERALANEAYAGESAWPQY